MGWRTVADVRDYSQANGSPYTVLVMLAERAPDETRIAHPGINLLAHDSRVSRSTCQRALKTLEELGEIRAVSYREGGRGMATDWEILVGSEKGSQNGTVSERVSSTTKRVSTTAQKGVTGDTPTKGTERTEQGERRAPARARITFRGKPVNEESWSLAQQVLAEFNRQVGTKYRAVTSGGEMSEAAKRIYSRCRVYPDLGLEEHADIIRRTLSSRWWQKGRRTEITPGTVQVGLVYGPKVFEDNITRPAAPADVASRSEEKRRRDERRLASIRRLTGRE